MPTSNMKREGFREISIDDIDTTKTQARQTGIDKNIDNLASSIEIQGLFSPVLVVSLNENKYELIAGQRRMKAYRDILSKKDPEKFSKIPAFIYADLQEWEKKAISINENFNQEPMDENDKIAAVTACFNEFDNMKTTAKKTGISYDHVRKYVKYERLPQVLKEMKTSGEISLNTAIVTADLYGFDTSNTGNIDIDDIKECATELEKTTPKQKKHIKERRIETGEPPKTAIKEVKNQKESNRSITTEVASSTYVRIEKYRGEHQLNSTALAASELIEEGLEKNHI